MERTIRRMIKYSASVIIASFPALVFADGVLSLLEYTLFFLLAGNAVVALFCLIDDFASAFVNFLAPDDKAYILLPNGKSITIDIQRWQRINDGAYIEVISYGKVYVIPSNKISLKLHNCAYYDEE